MIFRKEYVHTLDSGELSLTKVSSADRAKAFLLPGALHGCRLLVAQEIKEGAVTDGALIKSISGNTSCSLLTITVPVIV